MSEFLWSVFIALFVVTAFAVHDGCKQLNGWDDRCETTCVSRGQVHSRGNGVCTCRDGTVWIWREGYTQRLGEK